MRRSSAVICLVLLATAAGCRHDEAARQPSGPVFQTAPALARSVRAVRPLLGRVETARRVTLQALIEGRIERVTVPDGAVVTPGDTLLVLGGPRVAAWRSDLASTVASLSDELAAAHDRLASVQRRANSGLAAIDALSSARRHVAAAARELAAARAEQDRLEAALVITAPFGGAFAARRVSAGQTVQSGDTLAELFDPASNRVVARLLPDAGHEVATGQTGMIDRNGQPSLPVTVQAIRPAVDAAGLQEVWLSGPGLRDLAPGTAVRGVLVTAVHEGAVTVPESAVVRDREGRAFVFVGRAPPFSRRAVVTGIAEEGTVEIVAGLQAGEEVVTEGAYELFWSDFARKFAVPD